MTNNIAPCPNCQSPLDESGTCPVCSEIGPVEAAETPPESGDSIPENSASNRDDSELNEPGVSSAEYENAESPAPSSEEMAVNEESPQSYPGIDEPDAEGEIQNSGTTDEASDDDPLDTRLDEVHDLLPKRGLDTSTHGKGFLDAYAEPFPEVQISGSCLDPEKTQAFGKHLIEDHIVLVGCIDPAISFAAAHCLTMSDEGVVLIRCPDPDATRSDHAPVVPGGNGGASGAEEGIPDGEPENRSRTEGDLESVSNEMLTIDLLLKYCRQGVGFRYLVIDTYADSVRTFVDSLCRDDSSALKLKSRLRSTDIRLVCLIDPQLLNDINTSVFPAWDIPFLEPLLRNAHPEDHDIWVPMIREQRESRHWPPDDVEFHRMLIVFINEGTLSEEIEKIQNAIEAGDQARTSFLTDRIREYSTGDHQLEATVLFVGAFFPGTSLDEFIRLVEMLLGDRIEQLERAVPGAGESADQTTTVVSEVALADKWRENADAILRDCELKSTGNNGGPRAMHFIDRALAAELREFFSEVRPVFMRDMFVRLDSAGLIFDPSRRIAHRFRDLVVSMAVSDQDRYGSNWLLQVVLSLRNHESLKITEAGDERSLFATILKAIASTRLKGLVYSRLSGLVRQMLDRQFLVEPVNAFFKSLIETGNFDALLSLLWRLRKAPHLDVFHWVRLVFEQGGELARHQASQFMYRIITDDGADVYEVFNRVSEWYPDPDRNPSRYSQANRNALVFLMDFAKQSTSSHPLELYGEWPSSYALFVSPERAFAPDGISLFCERLFHPGMDHALGRAAVPDQAFVAARWDLILSGLGKEQNEKGALELRDFLIDEIHRCTDRKKRRDLVSAWRQIVESMLVEIGRTRSRDPESARQLTRARNRQRAWIKDFKNREVPRKSRESQE